MTDPYRPDSPNRPPLAARRPGGGGRASRPFLWAILAITASANLVTSLAEMNLLLQLGFGLVAVACLAILITDHVRHRR